MSLYENLKKVKKYNLKKREFSKTLPKDKKERKRLKYEWWLKNHIHLSEEEWIEIGVWEESHSYSQIR